MQELEIRPYYQMVYAQQFKKNAVSNIEQVLGAAPHKAAAVQPFTIHHEDYPS